MTEHDALERARIGIRPSALKVDDIYRRKGQRQTRRRVGAATTAFVIVLLTVVLFLRSFSDQAVVPGISNVPTPSTQTSPDVKTTAINFPSSFEIRAVATLGTLFVAVGVDANRGADAWYSSDGQRWDRAAVAAPGRGDAVMLGVVEVDSVLLAWGGAGDDGYVWRSEDGKSWESVPDESMFGGTGIQSISWISAHDGGVGGRERSAGSDKWHLVAWVPVSGGRWERIAPVSRQGFEVILSTSSIPDITTTSNDRGTVKIDSGQPSTVSFTPSEG